MLKKFELNTFLLSNNILREILKSNLLKGDYKNINNIKKQFIALKGHIRLKKAIKYF